MWIYDHHITSIDLGLQDFNQIRPHLQFTIELENIEPCNFLHLSVKRHDDELEFSIFHERMYTNTMIPFDSCHPNDQKFAALRFLTNSWNTYQLKTKANERNNIYSKYIVK